ncbi:helix-turn-helix domain-containing protein [Neotamlana nanhaiensis]|uniref:helix-turn-helix domain-containing protein n=1 Tax=Neotamlana nanhaiensis TaxID=1382798 RepID=UPI00069C9F58|nr:helix-turn-helix domain-containing protein [Tamlana nanhaiensis]
MNKNFRKKLIEVRTSKGLTQQEVAQLCNISVRTIQRIEAGMVEPRAYTIKKISKILEFDYFDESEDYEENQSLNQSNYSILWCFKDLFNLKTNAMKKLTILSIPVLLFALIFGLNSSAQSTISKSELEGAWLLCGRDSLVSTNVYGVNKSRIKIITNSVFTVMELEVDKKLAITDFVGTYEVNDSIYTEHVLYTHPNLQTYRGVGNFEFEIKGDLLFLKGIDNNYDEIWKRADLNELEATN